MARRRDGTVPPAVRAAARAYGEVLRRAFQQDEQFRAWGATGGKTRAKRLTADERRVIARKAARARWSADKSQGR